MFLVELAYTTIKEKITDLEDSQRRKDNAIEQSKNNLREDDETVQNHVQEDREETEKAE